MTLLDTDNTFNNTEVTIIKKEKTILNSPQLIDFLIGCYNIMNTEFRFIYNQELFILSDKIKASNCINHKKYGFSISFNDLIYWLINKLELRSSGQPNIEKILNESLNLHNVLLKLFDYYKLKDNN